MDDLISRQAAVDAINASHDMPNGWLDYAVDTVMALPSVEPEIIRCKDCRHRSEDGFCEGRGWPLQLVPDDGFCDKGKRSEDGWGRRDENSN